VLINVVLLILFGISWGMSLPLIKIAVSAGHHPLGLVFWQVSFSTLVLGSYLLVTRQPVSLRLVSLRYYLLIAILGSLVPSGFSLLAASRLPAGIMAIVIATVPLVSLLVALLARIELFSWQRCIGISLGVCALMLIALPETSLPDPTLAPWLLVALVAPVCYALEANFVAARAPVGHSAIATLFAASCIGVLLLLPIVWPLGWGVSLLGHWDISHWTLLGSSACNVVAYTGYLWLLARTGAVFTSQIAYVVTLTGVAVAVTLLGEHYGLSVWLAVGMMLAGLLLVKPSRVERPPRDGSYSQASTSARKF
jgi:drug/metabolite transporter (DMT)-like permease